MLERLYFDFAMNNPFSIHIFSGDSLHYTHDGQKFTTIDRDNDRSSGNCARKDYAGGGWWYDNCFESNLNGLYLSGHYDRGYSGMTWNGWKGGKYSLNRSRMMIRKT